MARRGRSKVLKARDEERCISIHASHDGYRRLAGKNLHCREWAVSKGNLALRDEIMGDYGSAEARFYLHPDIEVDTQKLDENRVNLKLPRGECIDFTVHGGVIQLQPATWHPGFGISVPNACIVITFRQSKVTTSMSWHKAA